MEENRKHPFLRFLLFDVSAFVGGSLVVFIIFTVIFGALNYFNILSLSSFYKPLSFLPRKAIVQQAVRPSPVNFSTFKYDVAKAEKLLIDYLKTNVKPEFLPPKIEVKQGVPNEFSAFFTTKSASFSATFHHQQRINALNDFAVLVQLEDNASEEATAALATAQTSLYFKDPYKISDCQTKEAVSYCENFQAEALGKRGYGMLFAGDPKRPLKIIFTCFIPKESRGFETQKSCLGLP